MLGWLPIPVPRTHSHSVTSMDNIASSSRQMRNEAEKKRRDTLNGYITELGRLVPTVDSTPRRIDKISILRLAATYLMQNQLLQTGNVSEKPFLPISLRSFNLSLSMVEEMDAFMLVVTSSGKIVFVSHTVEKLLGHAQIDMFGQSLFNFTLKEDHPVLAFNLKPDGDADATGEEGDADVGSGDDTSCSSDASLSPPPPPAAAAIDTSPPVPQETQRRSFFLQLSQRCVSRSEQPEYKRVHVLGNLRVPQRFATRRRTRRQSGDWMGSEGGPYYDSVLVAMVKLESRIRELSLLESNKDEYVTRHLIDGRIIYSDHRISLVAGYFTEEVSGMSAFKFMHQEDVMFTIVALRQMYDRGEGFGCSCYRLQSKTGQFIYLRTHGFLEKNEETNEVESFICINTLVREEDGKRLIQEMKTRYSANIDSARQTSAIMESEVKLQEAISQLIPATVDPPNIHSPFPDSQYMKAVLTGKSLPPPSVHTAQAGLGSPKSVARLTELGSPGPSGGHSPGRTAGSPNLERPSVITSSLRRRRHDSETLASVKRRRSPHHEELVIQVPPQMSPEELTHAILTRGQSSPYSPPVKTRRYTHSSDLSLTTSLPLSFLSEEHKPDPVSVILSPGQPPYRSPANPYNNGSFLSPGQATYTQSTDALVSPDQSLASPRDTSTNREAPYSKRQALEGPNQGSGPSFRREALLVPGTADEGLYSPDVGSIDHSKYFIENMLNQPDLIMAEMDQVQVPASTEGGDSDSPLYLIVEQSHSQLESNLQVQQMQITSIKQDIKQVPKPHSDQVFKNFTEIEDEHKQNQHLLHILKQDISRTCT